MSKMDKKQRKAKKREEKVKKIKMKNVEEQAASGHLSEEQKKSGKVQLYLFFGVAIAGALIIILNV